MVLRAAATSVVLRSTVPVATGASCTALSALSTPASTDLAVGIVLVKHGDALDADRRQLPHDGRGFVRIGRPQVEHVPVERIAQGIGTGAGRKKRHFFGRGQRQGRQRSGRAHVAKQGKHAILDQPAGIAHTTFGLIDVVQALDLDRAPLHTTLGIEPVKIQLGPQVILQTQLLGSAH